MHFTLYSEKSVAESVKALNERMAQSATSTRPKLSGQVVRSGDFTLAIESKVYGRVPRKTYIQGKIQKESGTTVIRGSVPDGWPPQRQRLLMVAIPVSAIALLVIGEFLPAVLVAALLFVLLTIVRGDYANGDRLLLELERNLKATPKAPKKPPPPARK